MLASVGWWCALPGVSPAAEVRAQGEVTAADRAWWAFAPVARPAAPQVRHTEWAANPIDAFVLARLEAKGLVPNPPADRRELIRRVYFDLIGLPPTPEEVDAFVADSSPDAYEKLIDKLLAMPQYGDRWARYWLDLVRYAQSGGYERDGETLLAWRFRDYVIRALNEDKPYDQFVREQLAGDEIDHVTDDSIIATGLYRLGVWDDEPDDKLQAESEYLDDNLRTIGTAFLGLTIGCARCHDHKFDPIPQRDYYQLLSFLGNVRPPEQAKMEPGSSAYTRLFDGQWALSVRERGKTPPKMTVLVRGNAHSPGAEVRPTFLTVLGGQEPATPLKSSNAESCGLRRALAEWIANRENPLTARVMVNRIWQYHFGRGIVRTPDDFGKTGLAPTHPELLDWLASEFVEQGWSIKRLHKLILLSSTYRMSSRATNADAERADPANDLFWRQNMRRLSAEALRDSLLSVSGELNGEMYGRGFFPHLSREAIAAGSRPGLGWEVSPPQEQNRRSIYAFLKRSMLPPMFETFDFNNVTLPAGVRADTTVAPQALMMLNDDSVQDRAAALADRVSKEVGEDRDRQIARAFELAVARGPTASELTIARRFLDRQQAAFAALPVSFTLRPEVPSSLSEGYLNQLKPQDFMTGPRKGWDYFRGKWGGHYEGIVAVDVPNGPFALAEGSAFSDGIVEAKLTLHNASELGALIVRGVATGDTHKGYDVVFHSRSRQIALERHDGTHVAVLASARLDDTNSGQYAVKIEAAGPRLRVWLNETEQPILDVTDPQPLTEAGAVGARTWGAAITVEDLNVTTDGKKRSLMDARPDPDRQALRSLCLMVLNLNEFAYVD